jgi:cyclopropane-fatty-acyl-phospholipid synthase
MGLGPFGPMLRRIIRQGTLEVIDPQGQSHRFGDGGEPRAGMILRGRWTPWKLALNPGLAVGEAFMDERLTLPHGQDIRQLLELLTYNLRFDPENPNRGLVTSGEKWQRWLEERNPAARAKRNVAHHYDLSAKLYELFLDADKQYSCAYFTDPNNSLEQAQLDKKRHIAAKLCLSESRLRILDIGCGWGGMALYLNKVAQAQVLGITLSEEQIAIAQQRAKSAGVADDVRFALQDYRLTPGPFDRIVSVGMFEHVGRPNYVTYFRKCRDLLSQDGVALIHTIGRAEGPGVTDAWTQKYIFPGGYAPALSEIMAAAEQAGLYVTDIEVLRLHYAMTLTHWYDRAVANRAAIEALYDARFFRLWTFYLAGAIMAFRHMGAVIFQLQLARKQTAVPLTRDYILGEEARLRALE